MPRRFFPRLCSSFLCSHLLKKKNTKKLPERAPTKTQLCVLSAITCVGTSTIRLRSIKSSLPFSLPYITHVINYRFSILQVVESWAGPGNEATYTHIHTHTQDESVDLN